MCIAHIGVSTVYCGSCACLHVFRGRDNFRLTFNARQNAHANTQPQFRRPSFDATAASQVQHPALLASTQQGWLHTRRTLRDRIPELFFTMQARSLYHLKTQHSRCAIVVVFVVRACGRERCTPFVGKMKGGTSVKPYKGSTNGSFLFSLPVALDPHLRA